MGEFPENLADASEEQDEHFQQDVKVMEECYQGWWDLNMIVDYWWNWVWNIPEAVHKRSKKEVLAVIRWSEWMTRMKRDFVFTFYYD